jgi:hypothetical protein
MKARLGTLVYVFNCLLAVAAMVIGVLYAFEKYPEYQWAPIVEGLAAGIVFWLIGRACLFVLAGR